jgi:hypothetical protein
MKGDLSDSSPVPIISSYHQDDRRRDRTARKDVKLGSRTTSGVGLFRCECRRRIILDPTLSTSAGDDMTDIRLRTEIPSGDMPPREFRRHVHAVVDWMTDYLANVGAYPMPAQGGRESSA